MYDSENVVELANDEDCWVRYAVAKNANTPTETLSELARDMDCDVKCAVKNNSNFKQ